MLTLLLLMGVLDRRRRHHPVVVGTISSRHSAFIQIYSLQLFLLVSLTQACKALKLKDAHSFLDQDRHRLCCTVYSQLLRPPKYASGMIPVNAFCQQEGHGGTHPSTTQGLLLRVVAPKLHSRGRGGSPLSAKVSSRTQRRDNEPSSPSQ